MNKIIIFGCGYVGQNLCKLLEDDFEIVRTHRSTSAVFNIESALPRNYFNDVTHILISIPPDECGDLVLRLHLEDIQSASSLKWIGLLSSTGVYGDHKGNWVNEDSQLLAKDASNLNRIQAEKQWVESFPDLIHIFRVAGIYGPERNQIDAIKNGTARRIYKKNHYFSRIHVDDIAAILKKSIDNPTSGEIYNLCDDLPSPSHEVIEYYCDQLGAPYPPMENYEEAKLSPLALNFYLNNKKVSNSKVKELLKYSFIHQNYRN